jgi:hypothetical protein
LRVSKSSTERNLSFKSDVGGGDDDVVTYGCCDLSVDDPCSTFVANACACCGDYGTKFYGLSCQPEVLIRIFTY